MLPFSKENHTVKQTKSIVTILLPEALLVTFTIAYFLLPVFIWNESLLITRPITSTLLFIIVFSFLESIVFCHVWNWCKSDQKIMVENYQQPVDFLKSFGIFLACFCSSHIICVLFGAALTNYVEETATWALLVSSLIAVPNICVFGSKLEPWYRVVICGKTSNHLEQLLYFECLGVVIGSWVSAIVIPLDWDRDWQVWPIPCIIGCIGGYVLSLFVHCILVIRDAKRIKLS